MSTSPEVDSFLARHPEVLVGRDAEEKARAGVADPGNTFDIVGKPLKDMVLIQQYDAGTKERLWAVALLNDEKAEKWCLDNKSSHEPDDCDACRALANREPDEYLYEKAPEQLKGKDGLRD